MTTAAKDYPIPSFFGWLLEQKMICAEDMQTTEDGFFMMKKSLSDLLASEGVDTFPDREDRILQCRYFFDDWFLYAIHRQGETVYSLCKMREQEQDKVRGIQADGDAPGVTVSFISLNFPVLQTCLEEPSLSNRKKLGMEINRVVAYPGQQHHPMIKAYFLRPEAQGPYLIAQLYTTHMASFGGEGILAVPEAYRECYSKRGRSKKYARLPDFLEENNRTAGRIVCDHRNIYLRDPKNLSVFEQRAILATHTANVSVHSFAAEIRYHAMFLTPMAKIRLPILGSPYASAVRADMSISDKEFQGPTPYYDLSGRLVQQQLRHHQDE